MDGVRADEWQVLLDVDALAAAEGENWVWAGADELRPDNRRYLVSLSRGGADASVVREFDLETGFVPAASNCPRRRSWISWIDIDTIFVATDFGPGTLTTSGYPRLVKRWRRGTRWPTPSWSSRREAGRRSRPGRARPDARLSSATSSRAGSAFFDSETYLLGAADELVRIDVPTDADRRRAPPMAAGTAAVHRGRSARHTYPAGALLAAELDAFLAGDRTTHRAVRTCPGRGAELPPVDPAPPGPGAAARCAP